jgi:hypothetical protein
MKMADHLIQRKPPTYRDGETIKEITSEMYKKTDGGWIPKRPAMGTGSMDVFSFLFEVPPCAVEMTVGVQETRNNNNTTITKSDPLPVFDVGSPLHRDQG